MTEAGAPGKWNLIPLANPVAVWQLGRMSNELKALPDSIAAGTTVSYRKSFADYPASAGWGLTLYLAGASVTAIAAAVDGDDFVVTLAAGDLTGDFDAGHYKWAERVDLSGAVHEVASGVVSILPDLSQATDGSAQEWMERAIVALKAHIEGRLPAGLESYQIVGRLVSKIPIEEAVRLLASFESKLAAAEDPTSISRTVLIDFTPTGYST